MIAPLIILAASAAAVPPPVRPDDIDRFIATCLDGGHGSIPPGAQEVAASDLSDAVVERIGKPFSAKPWSSKIYRSPDNPSSFFRVTVNSSKFGEFPSMCRVVTDQFDLIEAKTQLLERLKDHGVGSMDFLETVNTSNQDMLTHMLGHEYRTLTADEHDPDPTRFTLQTADPGFDIYGEPAEYRGAVLLSVRTHNKSQATDAARNWRRYEKIHAN